MCALCLLAQIPPDHTCTHEYTVWYVVVSDYEYIDCGQVWYQ